MYLPLKDLFYIQFQIHPFLYLLLYSVSTGDYKTKCRNRCEVNIVKSFQFFKNLLYSTALCFTCAWYSSIVTGGLLHLLVVQVLNISFNVTEREAQLALRNKTGQSRLCGLAIDTGEFSRGFYQNWIEFLTMADASVSPCSSVTDLV